MICYDKLFDLMKEKGKTKKDIRDEKIVGQETLRKLRNGTGIFETYDYYSSNGKEQKKRISSIDTRSIEALCVWLDCQPNDIMEVIPNTWENAEKLCFALGCEEYPERLSELVPMESEENIGE